MRLKIKSQRLFLRAGFTLVELLTVIAIIGLLTTLLFGGISRIKEKGNQVRCLNNLKQLALAVAQFAKDNDVYPDRERWLTTDARRGARVGQLYKYVGDGKLYVCPSDTSLAEQLSSGQPSETSYAPMSGVVRTNWSSGQSSRLTSYAYNGWFSGKNASVSVDTSLAVMFIEPEMSKSGSANISFDAAGPPLLTSRHSGGGHVGFGDTHVVYYNLNKYKDDQVKLFRETLEEGTR